MKRAIFQTLLILLFCMIPRAIVAQEEATPPAVDPTVTEANPAATNDPAPEAVAEATPESHLVRLAILPFQSRPKIDTRVAAAMVRELTNALTATGRFALLERSAMTDVSSALDYTRKGALKPESAAAWGAQHQLDYVIAGEVLAAGKGLGGMGIGGVRISSKAISLAVDIQLIDCKTAASPVADTFKEEKTGLGLAVGSVEFDPESRRGSEMVQVVLGHILREVLTAIEPPQVTAVESNGEVVTLNAGSIIFAPEERWELFKPMPLKAAAETSEARKGKVDKVGALRIVSVSDGNATATVVDGTASIGDIVRFDKMGKKKKE